MIRIFGWVFVFATVCPGATSTTWELNSYQDFLRGRLSGLSMNRDGRLMLAPKADTLFSSDQPQIWSVARANDGTLYLGTGNRGRLYKVDAAGKSSLLWTSEQPEIFAVAMDTNGVVYAGTSPDGKVYRIEDGKATEYFAPEAKYIWALAFASDGALLVGTGDQGKIFRVTAPGKGEIYYETGQTHVTCLAFDASGRLLAGSEPNGVLYRITAKDKAFVLYDANLPEIRTIVPMPDGTIYAAALGGSMGKRTLAATTAASNPGALTITAPATTITVTDTQAGLDMKPKVDAVKSASAQTVQTANVVTAAVDYAGVDKSALYKIQPDNTVETLWSSKEENIYDLAPSAGGIVFSTDAQGRIYRLMSDRKATLLFQTNEAETTRLIDTPGGLLAATGNMGKIIQFGATSGLNGTYESPVHDAGTVARWGRLNWHSAVPVSAKLQFRTRSGNFVRPDKTWSDWSAPLNDIASAPIASPNARYIQWKAEFTGPNGVSPQLDSVSVAYLPQNTPPSVRSINVTSVAAGAPASAKNLGSMSSAAASYSITVTDSGESTSPAGTPTLTLSRNGNQQTQIVWQADDPDGDRLSYSIYFRGEEEVEWKLLRTNVFENSLGIDADVLADGRYYFRVVATDRPANPPNLAREAELVSAPVLIDNTPPVVTASAPRRNGGVLDIDISAVDQTSPLRLCEYSIDAGPWIPMEAADGVTDSPQEKFQLHVENLRPIEHLVVIRAFDTAGNAGLTKVVVRSR